MAASVSSRINRLQAISPRQAPTNLQTDLTIGDFRLGADYMRDAANSFGLASTVTAGDDVRFWAGATFANRGTAPARIYESGNFSFGTGTKTLVWDGSDLSLGGASLVAGTAASTVVSNAAAGAAESGALAAAALKLAKAGGDILTGIIDVQQTTNYNAAIRTGDIAWNTTTGAITSGSGVAMTRLGLIGAAAGVATFSINATTGAAIFKGDITGASGTFSGDISTTGHVVASGSYSTAGIYAAVTGSATTANGVYGISTSGNGVRGTTENGNGVIGIASASGGFAVYGSGQVSGSTGVAGSASHSGAVGIMADNNFGGTALYVNNGITLLAAATTGAASVRIPHGSAPTSPTNGDMWTTTAGLYVRINGATVGPLT